MLTIKTFLILSVVCGIASAACDADNIEQDIILMLDYSGSIDQKEWTIMLEFCEELLNNYIPKLARVAGMGFGSATNVAKSWYFDYDKWGTYTDPNYIQTIVNNLGAWPKWGGKTYLEAGLTYLINNSPIDWDEMTQRKRLLLIFTDGNANDKPCPSMAPPLAELGIDVIVIGIGDGFVSSKVNCFDDIILANSFDELDQIIEKVGEMTCASDQDWRLTEVKAGSATKYIEFLNDGQNFNGESEIRISGSLLKQTKVISKNLGGVWTDIPQNQVVVLGSTSTLSSCQDQTSCTYFQVTFADEYVQAETKLTDWDVKIQQYFAESGETFEIGEVIWNGDFPYLSDPEYSFELKNMGYDNTLGANWRQGCDPDKVSIGTKNLDKCVFACETDAQCNPPDKSENTCAADGSGCICETRGYYDGVSSCDLIPEVPSCTVTTNPNLAASEVTWTQPAGSVIYGYEIAYGDYVVDYFGGERFYNQTFTDSELKTLTIASIGELQTGDKIVKKGKRYSFRTPCTEVVETFKPSTRPSQYPTWSPTEFQPSAFLGGYNTDDQTGEVYIKLWEDATATWTPEIRSSFPHPYNAWKVYWQLEEKSNGNVIEQGHITFPANALAIGQDIQEALLTTLKLSPGEESHEYTFKLLESTETMKNDRDDRKTYELYTPSFMTIKFYKERVTTRSPTVSPTEFMPWAFLGDYQSDCDISGDACKDIWEDQNYVVQIRSNFPHPYNAWTVWWELEDSTTSTVVESGTVLFPANALAEGKDILSVALTKLKLDGDELLHEYVFRLLESKETMPDDNSRVTYELYTPNSMKITYNKKEENTYPPTKQPTEYQPLVLMANFQTDDGGDVKPLSFHVNEEIMVSVRVTPSPPFAILAEWELMTENNTLHSSGNVSWPEDPFMESADIQFVYLNKIQLSDLKGRPRHEFTFNLVDAQETIPNDPEQRPMYEIYHPSTIKVIVEEPEELPNTVTDGGDETLPWWIIFAICAGCGFIILVFFYYWRKYRRKYKDQKHIAEELEEDLIIEEAGIGAFFSRRGVPENQVNSNPLHGQQELEVPLLRENLQAEMVSVDDSIKFGNTSKTEFGQRMK